MKNLFWLAVLALVGWLIWKQVYKPPPPPPAPSGPSIQMSSKIMISGHPYDRAVLEQIFEKYIKNEYLVAQGQVYHAWQVKQGYPLTFDQFISHLRNHYDFVQIRNLDEIVEEFAPGSTRRATAPAEMKVLTGNEPRRANSRGGGNL